MKNNLIHLKMLLFLVMISSKIYAQNSVTSSGSNGIGSGGSVSYSVGQISYTSAIGTGGNLNAGVQQPFEIFTLGVDNFPNISLAFVIYPNPTTSLINLKVMNLGIENLQYELLDLNGKIIEEKKIDYQETQIQMENNASGIYLLKILDKNKLIKTFKIIKK